MFPTLYLVNLLEQDLSSEMAISAIQGFEKKVFDGRKTLSVGQGKEEI